MNIYNLNANTLSKQVKELAEMISDQSDTKNTAGATNTSSKIYLVGATSQGANPQTYTHDTCYVGTDGHLYSNSQKVAPLASPAFTGTPTAPTAAAGTNSTQLATTAFVQAAVTAGIAANDAMRYMGTIAGAAPISSQSYGALTPAADKGDTYKVSTAGRINGVKVEIGDMLICNADATAAATASTYSSVAAKWDIIQTNIDGAVTTDQVNPSTGCLATWEGDGRTITAAAAKGSATQPIYIDANGVPQPTTYSLGKTVPSNAVFTDTDTKCTGATNHYGYVADSGDIHGSNASTITPGTTKVITSITLDDARHVAGVTEATVPAAADTKNTAGATNTSSKIFLVGATSQGANPQTYTHDTCYVGTDGHLYSNSKKVAPLDSPDFTGTPLAQTAAAGTTTRQLATTAFVVNEITARMTGNSDFVFVTEDSGTMIGGKQCLFFDDDYELGPACACGVTGTLDNSNNLITSAAVKAAIGNATGDIETLLTAL